MKTLLDQDLLPSAESSDSSTPSEASSSSSQRLSQKVKRQYKDERIPSLQAAIISLKEKLAELYMSKMQCLSVDETEAQSKLIAEHEASLSRKEERLDERIQRLETWRGEAERTRATIHVLTQRNFFTSEPQSVVTSEELSSVPVSDDAKLKNGQCTLADLFASYGSNLPPLGQVMQRLYN